MKVFTSIIGFILVNILIFLSTSPLQAQNINEFHYDNSSTDVGEFVEIYLPNPQPVDLSLWQVDLYKGDGTIYRTETLDNFTATTDTDGTYYVWNPSSIYNSSSGIALSNSGTLIQFISYEGTVTGVTGAANGQTSTDVGVSEDSSTPAGYSVAWDGTSWQSLADDTPGSANYSVPLVSAGGYGLPCLNAPIINLIGSPSGGIFTGPGVSASGSNFNFDPASAGVGVHTITYTYTDPTTGYSASATTDIEVLDVADAPNTINDIVICNGDNMPEVTPTSGAAGTNQTLYSQTFDTDGEGAIGPQPATVTPSADGSWIINGDLTGLTATTDYMQTLGGSLVARDLDAEVCFQTAAINISGLTNISISIDISETGDHEAADYVDVKYTIDGVETLITNWMSAGSSTHTLVGDLALGGANDDNDWGNTTVTQTGLSGNTMIITICALNNSGSESILIDNVTVTGTPSASVVYNFWDSDPTVGAPTPVAQQVTSYTPTTTTANSPQTYWVTVPTPNGCQSDPVSFSVTVNELPTVDAGTYNPTCINTDVTLSGTPAGGTFTGNNVNGTIFSASTDGTYKIYYEYTDGNGCTNIDSADIVVNPSPTVTLSDFTPVCVDASTFALSGGNPAGGTYSGTGVTNGNFDPATAGVGVQTITYSYTDATTGCTASTTATIEVLALPAAPVVADITVCEGGATNITFAGGGPVTTTIFTETFDEDGAGVTGTGATTPPTTTPASNGQWTITGDVSGLTATSDFFHVVNGVLSARDVDAEICFESQAINIAGMTDVGFSIDIIDAGDLEPEDYVDVTYIVDGVPTTITNWMSFGDATHTFIGDIPDDADWGSQTVTQTGISGSTLVIRVCLMNNAGSEYINLDNLVVSSTAPATTQYNFYDAANGGNLLAGPVDSYDPGTTVATSPQEIWITADNGFCESEPTMITVTVNPNPVIAASNNSPLCEDSTLLLMATGGTNMTWAWTGPNTFVSTDQNPTLPNVTTAMTGTYQVIGTNEFACTDTASTDVEVVASPAAPVVADIIACAGDTVTIDLSLPTTPQPIFTETFDESNIGLVGPCPGGTCGTNTTPSNGQWAITGDVSGLTANSDYFVTAAGSLIAQDLDNELCFITQTIDISNFSNVSFSVDISETGDHELTDYVDVTYIVDGVPTQIPNWNNFGNAFHTITGDHPDDGDWVNTTVTQTGINGTSLEIQICVLNNAGSEDIYIDNLMVSGIPTVGLSYYFYDADPSGASANLLAGPTNTYDVVPVLGAPFSVWIQGVSGLGCVSDATEVTVTALPLPTVFNAEISDCANATGEAAFYLEDAIPTITGGDASYTVVFYASEADAQSQSNPLTSPYTSPSTTVYAFVTNADGCHEIAELVLTTFDCSAEITDPCACTSYGNRNFFETIEITSPAGQVWTVTAVNGLSIYGSPSGVGFVATEAPAGTYTITGLHYSGAGYSITVTNQHGYELSMHSTCYYPDPTIESVYDGQVFCLTEAPTALVGSANGVSGTGSFDIDGNPVTELDPSTLTPGMHTLTFSFDAGTATPFDPTDPGCIETISLVFEVQAAPTTLGCVSGIQISLDENCEAVLTASQFLTGNGCYNGFIVDIIQPGTNQSMGNIANGSFVGTSWNVMVTDPTGAASPCWSTNITFMDKMAPTITCQTDVFEVDCTYDLSLIPEPTASDNCDPNPTVALVSQDVTANNICDGGRTIVQTWRAFDNNGMYSANCTQVIHVTQPLITFPGDITWTCDQYAAYPNITDTAAVNSGIVDWDTADNQNDIDVNPNTGNFILSHTGSGKPIGWEGTYCKYNVEYTEQTFAHCGAGTFKILRHWIAINLCTNDIQTSDQIILVDDIEAPVFDFTNNGAFKTNAAGDIYLEVSANVYGQGQVYCSSTDFVPAPAVTDNCSGVDMSTFSIITPVGPVDGLTANGGTIPVPGLAVGVYADGLTYKVADNCGNIREMKITLVVVDDIPPTMICDQITKVSLPANGVAKLYAEMPDDGSYDNCGLDHFEIRRMADNPACDVQGNTTFDSADDNADGETEAGDGHNNPIWGNNPSHPEYWNYDVVDNGEYVTFCCEDILSPLNQVVVRAYDVYGNYSECMVEVLVEDKQGPQCFAPADVTIDCNLFDPSLAPYGEATGYDNCDYRLDPPVVSGGVDQCNTGVVYRTWTITDGAGQSSTCQQTITVNYVQDFKVKFPNDQFSDACNALSDTIFPIFTDKDCELAGYSYVDQKVTLVQDACYKIIRHWTVMDWCLFDSYDDGGGTITPTHVDNPTNTQEGPTRQANATNSGYWTYDQIIKVIDNDAPTITCPTSPVEVCDFSNNCSGIVDLTSEATDACSGDNIIFGYTLYLDDDQDGIMETVIDDDTPGAPPITITHPDGIKAVANVHMSGVTYGTHKIKWFAKDGCGNIDLCEYDFIVKDCKKPTIAVNECVTVNLMNVNGGMITIWPGDPNNCNLPQPNVCGWDPSLGDNCTSDADLLDNLRIRKAGDGTGVPTTTSVTYTCQDLGTNDVEIWVGDNAGNWDYVVTCVVVQDLMNFCNPSPTAPIAGMVTTEPGAGVQDVDVTATNGITPSTITTPASGEYTFTGLPINTDYAITAAKDGDDANGVDVLDLLRIYQAILGSDFTSPYDKIAADVNLDGTVDIQDLLLIRKLTLGTISEFPNTDSWRFYDASCTIPLVSGSSNTGGTTCGTISILDLQAAINDADLIAVKMGDVNHSANPNQYSVVDDRSFGEFVLNTSDRMINAGETVEVTLNANRNDISGYQFTLELGSLEFVNVAGEGISFENNFAYHNDALTVSWTGESVTDEVFTITLRATTDVRLSEALSLDSRITEAMAADTEALRQDVKLAFNGKVVDQFTLFQNEPNPFSDRTEIKFYLPEGTSATLTIFDASGRTLKTVNGDYTKGMNTVSVAKHELHAVGVLYYKLETASNSAIRKMIIME